MNWYKVNKSEWKEIIGTVARELGRTELMVEKDIIQSMFLYKLAKVELQLWRNQMCFYIQKERKHICQDKR